VSSIRVQSQVPWPALVQQVLGVCGPVHWLFEGVVTLAPLKSRQVPTPAPWQHWNGLPTSTQAKLLAAGDSYGTVARRY